MVVEQDDGSRLRIPVARIQQVTFDSIPGIPANLYLVGGNGEWNAEKVQRFTHVENDPSQQAVFYYDIKGNGGIYDIWFAFGDDDALDSIAAGNWSLLYGATSDGGDMQGSFDRRYNLQSDNSFHVDGRSLNYRMTVNMADMTYQIIPETYQQFIYFIGATEGWALSEQRLESPARDGVYTGFLYIADPNGWGNEFKFQREPGNWDTQLNSGTFAGNITGDLEGDGWADGNIKATAGEGVYYITLDLSSLSLHGVKINNMNLVGGFNNWNPADDTQQMTWDAENYCFVKTGATVSADSFGWKFAANNGWDINLGGETPDYLEANGSNLTATGTTIRLYPTRRTSDNIYCTVE